MDKVKWFKKINVHSISSWGYLFAAVAAFFIVPIDASGLKLTVCLFFMLVMILLSIQEKQSSYLKQILEELRTKNG